MNIAVLKFGGSVIGGLDDIGRVARRIKERMDGGAFPVVVVSAMRGMTDELMGMARALSPHPPGRELDMLISVGERISMSLLAIALNELGIPARSYTGSQVGIITENRHTSARVYEVKLYRILDSIREGVVPIVAGFQGVSLEREVTTLGRGGSDLTAVALTVALRRHFDEVEVEFYKNVEGVLPVAPSIATSRPIPLMSYEEMITMSSLGARIIHSRAASLAARYEIPLHIHGLESKGGTVVKKVEFLEAPHVRGIVSMPAVSVYLRVREDRRLPQVISRLSSAGVSPVLFYHTYLDDEPQLAFVIRESDLGTFMDITSGYDVIEEVMQLDRVLVSVVGYGVGNSSEVKDTILSTSEKLGIHVDAFISDDYRVSLLIDRSREVELVRALAEAFDLIAPDSAG